MYDSFYKVLGLVESFVFFPTKDMDDKSSEAPINKQTLNKKNVQKIPLDTIQHYVITSEHKKYYEGAK